MYDVNQKFIVPPDLRWNYTMDGKISELAIC